MHSVLRAASLVALLIISLAAPVAHGQSVNEMAWLAAYKIDVNLPYGVMDAYPGGLPVALENERVPGAVTEQLPLGFLPAHLRLQSRSGTPDPRPTANFTLKSFISAFPDLIDTLRYQEGANRFATPWVVILADPRGSIRWTPAIPDKAAVGCFPCERPPHVAGKTEANGVYEMWAHGRSIVFRPEAGIVGSYAYLGEQRRLEKRFTSLLVDTVRIPDQVLPSKTPPLFGTQSVNDVLVHSGELVREGVDLAIKGRGLDFVLRRFYSSAVYSFGPLGRNFDSPLFARIVWLPAGGLLFYDGTGRVQRFGKDLTPFPGVFLRARNSEKGAVIAYPDNTMYHFDLYGRLSKITDPNMTRVDESDGNVMHFSYNEEGRLDTVIDSVGRIIRFEYYAPTAAASGGTYPGLLSTVTDFTGRIVKYRYDQYGRLTTVTGPDPLSPRSAQQVTTYTWGPAPTSGNFRLDVLRSGQITSEKDGKGRTLYTVAYNGDAAWRADSVTTSLGTWNYTYSAGTTTVTDPLGRSTAYGIDADGHVTSVIEPGGATTRYAFDAEGRLTNLVRPMGTQTPLSDATTYSYAAGGNRDKLAMLNLTQIADLPRPGSDEAAAGMVRTTTITYGERNRPTKIVEPGGRSTVIGRDERGNPSTLTDAAGITTTLEFDGRGQLKKVEDPRAGTTSYTYFTADKLRVGYAQTATTSAGTIQYSVDPRGNLTKVTQPNGVATTYVVNALDQTEEESTTTRKIEQTYDAAGMLGSQSVLAGTGPGGSPLFHAITFDIDEAGRVRSRTDDGRPTTYGYDAAGNLTSTIAPSTAPVTYGYDDRNRLTSILQAGHNVAITHDDDGAFRTMTNARGKTTSYVVSGFGETIAAADPSGILDATTLDAGGRPVGQRTLKKLPTGETMLLRWSEFAYDPLGRVTRETRKRFTAPLMMPATGDPSGATDIVTETLYDDAAHTMTVIDPAGNRIVTTYDTLGRVAKVTDAAGNTIETAYDENGNRLEEKTTDRAPDGTVTTSIIRYIYDRDNRLVSVRNMAEPNRETAIYRYDERGNMIEAQDAMGRATTYEYDLRGNKVKETDPERGVTEYRYDDADRLILLRDPKNNETTFGYDDRGNLTTERRADGATWTHTYDENGNRKTTTDPNGTLVTNTYNDRDELVQRDIVRGADVIGPARITWNRDDLGRAVATETDAGVKTTAAYDSLDQLLTEAVQIGSGPVRTVAHGYDFAGNETSRTYPSGLAVSMSYTPLNALAVVSAAGSPPLARYAYAGSRIDTRTLVNGVAARWTYDPLQRLETITHLWNAPDTLASVRYVRNPAGEKISALRPELARQVSYEHNRNGWIVAEQLTRTDTETNSLLRRTAYDIDPALNFRRVDRIVQTNTTTTTSASTSTNARNQYTSFGGETLAYDRNGNLRTFGGTTLSYDAENRLTRATVPSGLVEQTYDAAGRKVRTKEVGISATSVTDYVLTGDQVLEEYIDATLNMRYVRGRGVDEIVRAERSSGYDGQLDQILFPLQDELGNVERLTGADGETLERYEYEGYGEFRIFAGEAGLANSAYGWRWLFQGREHLPKLGAYDFRARTLWPEFGRFGQEDPLGAVDSSNLYQAFLAAPNQYVDPSGSVIAEVAVLASPRARRYTAVKNSFLLAPLGAYVWSRFSTVSFRLEFTGNNTRNLSAETKRKLDASGNYTFAEISVGPNFGREPAAESWYAKGRAIYARDRDHDARNVYTMGHEFGHLIYGFDPITSAAAHQIDVVNSQIRTLEPQHSALLRIPARRITAAQRQQLAQLRQQISALSSSLPSTAQEDSEKYADGIGEVFYYSYRAAHPARRIRVPSPTPTLPQGGVP